MSIERVRAYLRPLGYEARIQEFTASSATVELAAQAVGVIPARIAKTLSFRDAAGSGCLLVLTAGDARIDNHKFKEQFHCKARFLSPEEAIAFTGHAVGGVCPFAIPEDIPVYLDVSLRRFDTVFPAAGSSSSAVALSCDELFSLARARDWIDVCKDWKGAED